jgi:DNA mismatch endonuclease, patch repair protein
MAAIRSKGNKETEIRLAKLFRAHRISGWRRHEPILGKPDFVFRKERLAVFVDGCFWHGCPVHGRNPTTNKQYWVEKLQRNRLRDLTVKRGLTKQGWTVVRLWGHELAAPNKAMLRITTRLNRARKLLN